MANISLFYLDDFRDFRGHHGRFLADGSGIANYRRTQQRYGTVHTNATRDDTASDGSFHTVGHVNGRGEGYGIAGEDRLFTYQSFLPEDSNLQWGQAI